MSVTTDCTIQIVYPAHEVLSVRAVVLDVKLQVSRLPMASQVTHECTCVKLIKMIMSMKPFLALISRVLVIACLEGSPAT